MKNKIEIPNIIMIVIVNFLSVMLIAATFRDSGDPNEDTEVLNKSNHPYAGLQMLSVKAAHIDDVDPLEEEDDVEEEVEEEIEDEETEDEVEGDVEEEVEVPLYTSPPQEQAPPPPAQEPPPQEQAPPPPDPPPAQDPPQEQAPPPEDPPPVDPNEDTEDEPLW